MLIGWPGQRSTEISNVDCQLSHPCKMLGRKRLEAIPAGKRRDIVD